MREVSGSKKTRHVQADIVGNVFRIWSKDAVLEIDIRTGRVLKASASKSRKTSKASR